MMIHFVYSSAAAVLVRCPFNCDSQFATKSMRIHLEIIDSRDDWDIPAGHLFARWLAVQGGAKNGATGHPISLQIFRKLSDRNSNCMEIGGLLQYYMLNTVINFSFKNFIALWCHLTTTQLLSFIHTVQIDLSITQCDEIFKQKKLMTVFSI